MYNQLKKLRNIFLEYCKTKIFPLPRIIHVETRSKCNEFCNFCPASVNNDKRKDIYMTDGLINKIIAELKDADYYNRLSFYNNNEPFLDERIFEIIRNAREKLPKAYLELKSNGLLLDTGKILKVFNCGLDMLYINYYSGSHKVEEIARIKADLKKIRRFKGHFERGLYFERIKIYSRDPAQVMGSRAGTSPNKNYIGSPLKKICFRPFEMMAISPDGSVSVCSEDFHHAIGMGNVFDEALFKIWSSDRWNDIRFKLIAGDRSCSAPCSKCDYKGYTYEMFNENGLERKSFLSGVRGRLTRLLGGIGR